MFELIGEAQARQHAWEKLERPFAQVQKQSSVAMGQEMQACLEALAPSERTISVLVHGQSPSVEAIVENLKGRGTAQVKQQHEQQSKQWVFWLAELAQVMDAQVIHFPCGVLPEHDASSPDDQKADLQPRAVVQTGHLHHRHL